MDSTKNYRQLMFSLVISFVIMYTVMFLNIDRLDHYYTSLTRIYMTLLMVAPMALVMILIMSHMYSDRRKNIVITVASISIFILALLGLRSQTPINDVQYMKAMIPHHSSAIMVSEKANLKDPEVIKLSKEIIEAQEREIAQMENAIKRLE